MGLKINIYDYWKFVYFKYTKLFMLCRSIISDKGKKITNIVPFIKIIIFDISAGFNQTKIKVKRKIIMMFDGDNDNVLIIKVPKWTSILHGKQWKQWLNLFTHKNVHITWQKKMGQFKKSDYWYMAQRMVP